VPTFIARQGSDSIILAPPVLLPPPPLPPSPLTNLADLSPANSALRRPSSKERKKRIAKESSRDCRTAIPRSSIGLSFSVLRGYRFHDSVSSFPRWNSTTVSPAARYRESWRASRFTSGSFNCFLPVIDRGEISVFSRTCRQLLAVLSLESDAPGTLTTLRPYAKVHPDTLACSDTHRSGDHSVSVIEISIR